MEKWIALLKLLIIVLPMILEFLEGLAEIELKEKAANAFCEVISNFFKEVPSVEDAKKAIVKVFVDVANRKFV